MLLACQKLEAAMKFRTTSPAFVAAAVFLAAMYAVSAAQAFTIENQGGASGGPRVFGSGQAGSAARPSSACIPLRQREWPDHD